MCMNTSSFRAGKQHRVNTERYFHVMGQGWYVLTREGVGGPFIERNEAKLMVKQIIDPDSVPAEKSEEEDVPRWEGVFLR